MPLTLVDSFHRTIDYLRISVTDRCNFRCQYCLPPEGIEHKPREAILTFDEIERVVRLFMQMGGKRVRLTGGEPLMRHDLPQLVHKLSGLAPRPHIGLTTNGSQLADCAGALQQAGLDGVNVSLDSLHPRRFASITASPQFEKVMNGLEQALALGITTKLNVVALAGMTDEEIVDFARLADIRPLDVRFIEFMPLCGTGWHPEWVFSIDHVKQVIQQHFRLTALPRSSEVAEMFTLEGGVGRVGFIASMSHPFCQHCSRVRLTADGKLRPCLFSEEEVDLLPLLRNDADDHDLMAAMAYAVWKKPFGHQSISPTTRPEDFPRIHSLGG